LLRKSEEAEGACSGRLLEHVHADYEAILEAVEMEDVGVGLELARPRVADHLADDQPASMSRALKAV